MLYRILLLCLLLGAANRAGADVGTVEAAKGSLTIVAADGSSKATNKGSAVDNGDTVATGKDSWAVLHMYDGASLTLRPETRFRITAYHFEEAQPDNNKSWLELLSGTLRSITGLIGKENPRHYQLRTATATIGVRGTDHETTVVDDAHAAADTPTGTYDSVNDGETVITGKEGALDVQSGKVGYLQQNGTSLPHFLSQPPPFIARWREFDKRQGVLDVLSRLHQRVRSGAFQALPHLRERMQQKWPRLYQMVHPPVAGGKSGFAETKDKARGWFGQRLQQLRGLGSGLRNPPPAPRSEKRHGQHAFVDAAAEKAAARKTAREAAREARKRARQRQE